MHGSAWRRATAVLMNEQLARRTGLAPGGDTLPLDGPRPSRVAGVYRITAIRAGRASLDLPPARSAGPMPRGGTGLRVADGRTLVAAIDAMRARFDRPQDSSTRRRSRPSRPAIFERTFAVTAR